MPVIQSITPQVLQERLAALARELSTREDALALLALGSVGTETERLDSWSDLDFFVVVRDGAKRRYIDNLDWLAAVHPLAWHFQNTVDGHKGLMADGVFCEFAVFETHELSRIPYAPGRFIWRREEVDETLVAAMVLPVWAPGYAHSVSAALALLSALEAHNVVPVFVAAHIRQLATMAIQPSQAMTEANIG